MYDDDKKKDDKKVGFFHKPGETQDKHKHDIIDGAMEMIGEELTGKND